MFFLLLCVAGGVLVAKNVFKPSSSSQIAPITKIIPTSSPTPATVGEPVRLTIPKLSVKVIVEPVKLDSQGRIDVPSNFLNVGWYSLGPKPGEVGSAVIDGHFDTPSGAPSVFWDLKTLAPGDTVYIEDQNGKTYRFTVEKVVSYPLEHVPMADIVKNAPESRLNLITCGGSWDQARHIYNERVVVFSKM